MATGNTNFGNDAGTGTVGADGFNGPLTGSIAGASTLAVLPQLVSAAGATQGAATAITGSFAVITVCTASARGVKLPTAATGKMVFIMSACTQGTKVYPFSGDKISTSATNTAVVQAGFKGKLYFAKDAVTWYTLIGA